MKKWQQEEDPLLKVFDELSSLMLDILRSPQTPIDLPATGTLSSSSSSSSSVRTRRNFELQGVTPARIGWLLLGICLSLTVCGSVMFLIGFMLMPLVLGLAIVFCVVSSLSMLGRFFLSFYTSSTT